MQAFYCKVIASPLTLGNNLPFLCLKESYLDTCKHILYFFSETSSCYAQTLSYSGTSGQGSVGAGFMLAESQAATGQ